MKKLFFAIFSFCLSLGAFAQNERTTSFQIEVDAIHSRSNVNHYYSNWGSEIYFNRIVNKHRVGISVRGLYNRGAFSCNTTDSEGDKIYQYTNCWNKWLGIKLNYAYNVYASEHSAISVSPFVSLNYLIIDESGVRNSVWYQYQKKYNNKFGFGVALEYEVKFNAFSTSLKLAPDCVFAAPIKVGYPIDNFSVLFNIDRCITLKYTFGESVTEFIN